MRFLRLENIHGHITLVNINDISTINQESCNGPNFIVNKEGTVICETNEDIDSIVEKINQLEKANG